MPKVVVYSLSNQKQLSVKLQILLKMTFSPTDSDFYHNVINDLSVTNEDQIGSVVNV